MRRSPAYKINPQSSKVAYISDYVLDSVELGRQNLSVRMLSRRFTRQFSDTTFDGHSGEGGSEAEHDRPV
jgi:hypothetical protein